MWCTASFLHAVGQTVVADGSIVPLDAASNPVFDFIPVSVSCNERFLTTWRHDGTSANRFMLRIRDVAGYAEAMTVALRETVVTVS